MPLSFLALTLTLFVWAFIGLTWVDWSMNVVYIFALITAILRTLEMIGAFNYTLPARRRD